MNGACPGDMNGACPAGTMSSGVLEEVCLTPQSKEADRLSLQKSRSAAVQLLCSLYALVLVVLGIAFPLTYFVSGAQRNGGLYLSIFHIYIYLGSLVFLLYVHFTVAYHKRQLHSYGGDKRQSVTEENGSVPQEGKERRSLHHYGPDRVVDKRSSVNSGRELGESELSAQPGMLRRRGTLGTMEQLNLEGVQPDDLPFYYAQDGVNFFLRLSVIGFGMCSIVFDGFRLVQFAQTGSAWRCYGLLFVVHTSLRLIYVFCLAFFIFKNHRVVLNFHKCLIKLGLLHTLATNLCIWSITIALETSESYTHLGTMQYEITETDNNTEVLAALDNTGTPGACHGDQSLADKASSFLYPCVVQFCLIASAILYRMYTNIGAPPFRNNSTLEDKSRPGLECQKSTSGLFLGLFVLTLTTIGVCFYLLYNTGHNPLTAEATSIVYFLADIIINLMAAGASAVAFWKIKQLRFVDEIDVRFHQYMMLLGLGGFYLVLVFLLVPSISIIHTEGIGGVVSKCFTGASVISFCQATSQVIFILDSLRRRASQRAHYKSKPGRSLVTFLMICNFSLWLINTFQLKEVHTAPTFTSFYGSLAWLIILHMCFPLTIFYRFYSTIALSEIWTESYKRKSNTVYG